MKQRWIFLLLMWMVFTLVVMAQNKPRVLVSTDSCSSDVARGTEGTVQAGILNTLSSSIKQLNGLHGSFVVDDVWPGKPHADDYQLGKNWYSDRSDRTLYEGKGQGARGQDAAKMAQGHT